MNPSPRLIKDFDHDTTSTNLYKLWVLQPVLFVLGLVLLQLHPHTTLSYMPNLAPWSGNTLLNTHIQTIPTDIYTVWRLGRLSENRTEDGLRLASALAGWNFSSLEELSELGNILKDYETTHQSLPARIWGFINFVNIFWLISIVGISITIFPFIAIVLEPVALYMAEIATILYTGLLQYKFLLEPFGYFMCYLVSVQSFRYPQSVGLYIALVSIGMFTALFTYSGEYHQRNKYKRMNLKRFLYCTVLGIVTAVMAVHFQSKLFSFATIGLVHIATGFSIACHGLCYAIGFENKNALERSVITSIITLPAFFWLSTAANSHTTSSTIIAPFIQPVYIFSTIVYLLALLIVSSQYYQDIYYQNAYQNYKNNYFNRQLLMIISLTAITFVGCLYGITSFYNTAIVFTVLYLVEKFVVELSDNIIVKLFLVFVGMFVASLYLHTHPEFVISLFTPKFYKVES